MKIKDPETIIGKRVRHSMVSHKGVTYVVEGTVKDLLFDPVKSLILVSLQEDEQDFLWNPHHETTPERGRVEEDLEFL